MKKTYKILALVYSLVFLYFSVQHEELYKKLFILLVSALTLGLNIFIISYRKLSVEKKFGIAALIFGFILIFVIPVLHGIDEGAHFYKVYSFFYDTSVPEEFQDQLEDAVPNAIISADSSYNVISMFRLKGLKIDESKVSYTQNYIGAKLYSPISYLTYLLPMFLFKCILNLDVYWVIILGRIFSFLAWLAISYYTIKIMPKRKEFMAFLCLMPISLTLVTTYTGDLITNASIFLFIAIWYKIHEEKRPIKLKEIILISILGIISCCAKMVYALIFLIMFLLPKECFKSKKHKIISCCLIILVLIITFIINITFVGSDLLEFYPAIEKQKEFIFSHPFEYLKIFFRTFITSFVNYIYQFTTGKTTMCHNAILVDNVVSLFYFVVLVSTLFLDENKIELSKKAKTLIGTICFLVVFIIITSLYVQWTATKKGIGHPYVDGVQGRYFIPLAVLAIFIKSKPISKLNKDFLWSSVLLINLGIMLKICNVFFF